MWALICGCASFLCGIFAAIPAIILGHMGLSEIKKNPGMQGRGMALAGVILGYVITAFSILYIGIVGISVLIALGNQVKDKESSTSIISKPDSSDTSSTNTPDQSTNAPDTSTNAAPDASTNSAMATPADQSTNSPTATPTAPANQ
jgi:peptidyl-prolyl cis-trans isomerase B (cyclophilin B)